MSTMKFEVDSALLSELGERLVGSVQVALMELVKNSYDADATEVKISIDRKGNGVETLIEDNGHGMTFEQVGKYWMRIATTHKVADHISPRYGRPKSGAKGIGRFSCRRLGSKLTLITTAKKETGQYESTRFSVDWDDFRAGVLLNQLSVECETNVGDNGSVGTTLQILSDNPKLYSDQSLKYIKRNSVVLVANRGVTRAGFERDPGFNISFRFFGVKDESYKNLREELIEGGWGCVTGYVDAKGYAKLTLTAIDGIREQFVSKERFTLIKGARLKIGALVDNSSQIQNKEILTLGVMREVLSEWGGVYIRHNGVRIEPYGNPADDWLLIDRDRGLRRLASEQRDVVALSKTISGINQGRYLLNMLSSRSYVGDVYITTGMNGFEIKASREGLLLSDSFAELKTFTRLAIDYITLYRERYLQEKEDQKIEKASLEFLKKTESEVGRHEISVDDNPKASKIDSGAVAVEYIKTWAPGIDSIEDKEKRNKVISGIARAADLIELQQKKFNSERTRLRLVASTSVLLSLFSHDVRAYLVTMREISLGLKSLVDENPVLRSRIWNIREKIDSNVSSFERLINLTLSIAAPGQGEEERKLSLKPHLSIVKDCFAAIMSDYGVSCDIGEIPEVIFTGVMRESELYSILVNIISNAIKAVVARAENGAGKVKLVAERKDSRCLISCMDNGIGVNVDDSVRLFRPFVVDPEKMLYPVLSKRINSEHNFVLGNGSGLGLSIVKQIVEGRGGFVSFVKPSDNWNTQLQILI